jgi:hypothetical protein
MRWMIGIVIVLQLPVVMLYILAAGTDGKKASILPIYSVCFPILFSAFYALFRLVTADKLVLRDKAAIGLACLPITALMLALAWKLAKKLVNM